MTQGIEFLENIYGQLHEAGIVRSKGEFSERLLGKSPSYLTSMRAKQRAVSNQVIMGLGDAIYSEIKGLHGDESGEVALRHAMAQVNIYLAEQTLPRSLTKQVAHVGTTQTIAPEPFDLTAAIRWLAGLDPRNA
ncbi:DUF6626 family protein [Pelagibacterium mangrovi]|uniref:DUF6626 family protein n=1 Tax=Pelagibacterium mangrovi TaxID=3119828 RepID=UPI002FC7B1CD